MTAKQWALYRYLTVWADFTAAEAITAIHSQGHYVPAEHGRTGGTMQHREDRRAA